MGNYSEMTCKILLHLNFNRNSNFPSHTPPPPPVLSAPPRSVSVIQLANSSTISVSWEPPPQFAQSGLILEYKVRPEMLRIDLKVVMEGGKKSGTDCSGSLGVCTGSSFHVDTLMEKNTDFNDQLGISHGLVSAATSTCARKGLFSSSMTVPVICLFHQKHRVLIISCAQTQRCLLIISGGSERKKNTEEHTVLLFWFLLPICLFILAKSYPIQLKRNQFPGNFLDLWCLESCASWCGSVQYLSVSSVSPQVWCLSSGVQPEEQINRTVDRTVLSVVLTGLLPDTPYTVTVAAVTGLGVGAQSPPINLLSRSMKTSMWFRTKVEHIDLKSAMIC